MTEIQKTVVVKRGSQLCTEVYGVYRSKRLLLPVVGEELRIVNIATREELPGVIIGVHPETNTYDIRFLNAEHGLEE